MPRRVRRTSRSHEVIVPWSAAEDQEVNDCRVDEVFAEHGRPSAHPNLWQEIATKAFQARRISGTPNNCERQLRAAGLGAQKHEAPLGGFAKRGNGF